jgi:hypothetical protein
VRRGYILLTLTACIGASIAWADSLPSTVRSLLQLYAQNRDPGDLYDLAQTDAVSAYIHDRIVEEALPSRISISAFRNDLQAGSFAATGASTSIVAQPGLTDLISAAIETGAVSRKTDTEAITTSFNALPVYQVMSGRIPAGCGGEDEDCFHGPGRWIRGLSGSVSFALSNPTTPVPADTSAGIPALAGFLFSGQQLSALSARYELLVRERDPKNLQKIVDDAANALSDRAASFLTAQGALETELQQILTKTNWPAETKLALQSETSYSRMEEILLARYRLAYNLARQAPEFQALLAGMIPAQAAYIKAQNTLLAEKLYRKALTLDYVHQRPSDQPWLDQARLVFSTPLGSKPASTGESPASAVPPGSFTLNAGVTFYQALPQSPASSGRVRDAEVSTALGWSPAGWGDVRPTYTVAYYFQYMIENGVVQFNGDTATAGGAAIRLPGSAVEVLKTKGPIHVAQFGLNIPAGKTGISFPAAVSWSNRTELITGKSFWQGHVGVSYDLGRLKTLFEPGTN